MSAVQATSRAVRSYLTRQPRRLAAVNTQSRQSLSSLIARTGASTQSHLWQPTTLQESLLQPRFGLYTTRSMVVVTRTSSADLANHHKNAVDPPLQNATDITTTTLTLNDCTLTITASCWKRILTLMKKKQTDDWYLRVFVDAGGCSGFTYQFETSDEALDEEEDLVFAGPRNARLVVDKASLNLIQGSTIDYVQEMIKSTFEVRNNPQSESACGCGSSFAVKNFAANPATD
jgi:iron-sulfur cluster assembly accessory protein